MNGRITDQRTRIKKLETSLLDPLERVEGIAKKAEATVRGRLEDLRASVDQLLT